MIIRISIVFYGLALRAKLVAIQLHKMLKGEVNPSGRLTDTYAYDLESNPAVPKYW